MSMTKNTPTLGFLLHDVARLLRKRFEQNARGSGLTRSQWQVLAYLSWNDGIHQNGLAELLDVEPITLGRIVDKLEACGLVERHPHPTDRRVHLLRLTAAAGPKLALMQELGDITRGEALAGVSEAERARLMEVLQLLRSNLVEACDAPAAAQKQVSAVHE
jgi:MarR family transcriptional regulator, transcriptional regulator for hemolysin